MNTSQPGNAADTASRICSALLTLTRVTPAGAESASGPVKRVFKGSDDWWTCFRDRHDLITLAKLYGQAGSANFEGAEAFIPRFKAITKAFQEKGMLYNFDESLMHLRIQKSTHVVVRRIDRRCVRGLKKDNLRVGIGACLCADGTKVTPVVCHTADFPQPWTKKTGIVQVEDQPYIYHHTKHGWVTTDAFMRWFTTFVDHVKAKAQEKHWPQTAMLLMDNASYHCTVFLELARHATTVVDDEEDWPVIIMMGSWDPPINALLPQRGWVVTSTLEHERQRAAAIRERGVFVSWKGVRIRVLWLPPRTTSILQPADAGFFKMLGDRVAGRRKLLSPVLPVGSGILDLVHAHWSIPEDSVLKSWSALWGQKPLR